MKPNIARWLAICAVAFLFAGAALADGVPLFKTSPPGLSASTVDRVRTMMPTKSVVGVDIDAKAIDTTIITAQLEGKTYRFVGARRTLPPSINPSRAPGEPVAAVDDGGDFWEGRTPEGDSLMIGRSRLGISAQLLLGGRPFHVFRANGQTVLVEVEPLKIRNYDGPPTPEMIEAARKRRAAASTKP